MRSRLIVGVVISAITTCLPLLAQSSADEVIQLKQRVSQLEKQVQEITNYLEPIKAQLLEAVQTVQNQL